MDLAAGYGAGIDKIESHINDTGLTFVSGIDISANIEAACEKYIRFCPELSENSSRVSWGQVE
ncbi:hypothetical protein [Francisella salimarina]|uniref:hypothetical protein n=1 Tax=Francisella salimarina TaxID=2599927 RepID=UPI003D813931